MIFLYVNKWSFLLKKYGIFLFSLLPHFSWHCVPTTWDCTFYNNEKSTKNIHPWHGYSVCNEKRKLPNKIQLKTHNCLNGYFNMKTSFPGKWAAIKWQRQQISSNSGEKERESEKTIMRIGIETCCCNYNNNNHTKLKSLIILCQSNCVINELEYTRDVIVLDCIAKCSITSFNLVQKYEHWTTKRKSCWQLCRNQNNNQVENEEKWSEISNRLDYHRFKLIHVFDGKFEQIEWYFSFNI